MSSKSKHERRMANVASRPSAGNAIEVVGDPIVVGLGRSIKIDLGKLATPQNVYDADYAWIEHRVGAVSLFFAKKSRDEPDTLRTRLEVRYPVENLVGHFWGNSRDFHQKLKEFVSQWPADAMRDASTPTSMKALKEHSEWANLESMSHAGTEAVVDFYSMSLAGLARFARGQGSDGLVLAPVVRIQTSIFVLIHLLDECEAVVREIEAYFPQQLKEQRANSRGDQA